MTFQHDLPLGPCAYPVMQLAIDEDRRGAEAELGLWEKQKQGVRSTRVTTGRVGISSGSLV